MLYHVVRYDFLSIIVRLLYYLGTFVVGSSNDDVSRVNVSDSIIPTCFVLLLFASEMEEAV